MTRHSFRSIAVALLLALTWVGCGEDRTPLSPLAQPSPRPASSSVGPLSANPADSAAATNALSLPRPGSGSVGPLGIGVGNVISGTPLANAGRRVLIGFRGRPDAAVVQGAGGRVRYVYRLVPAVAATIPEAAINLLRARPGVAYVEPDVQVRAIDAELDNSWGVQRIGAGAAHDGGNKGGGVRVGILDTGIDYTHPDLDGNYAGGYDFVNGDPDPRDDHGHGTHVAGIVAAEDNGAGVVGVAPAARIYALKVLDAGGSGYSSDIVAALEWCVNNGIRVTNNSYGSVPLPLLDALDIGGSTTMKDAFDRSAAAGVVHVAAAGNSGNFLGIGDNEASPARYESVIAVAATDRNNGRASFSSTGPDVELAAPGVSVYSTMRGGGYGAMSGTSQASPHVAGAAALAIAAGVQDVRRRLQTTAQDLGVPGRDWQYGYGLVDARRAAASGLVGWRGDGALWWLCQRPTGVSDALSAHRFSVIPVFSV